MNDYDSDCEFCCTFNKFIDIIVNNTCDSRFKTFFSIHFLLHRNFNFLLYYKKKKHKGNIFLYVFESSQVKLLLLFIICRSKDKNSPTIHQTMDLRNKKEEKEKKKVFDAICFI